MNISSLRLTREGKRFLLATFLIAIAAVNTGNNLIYLILSLMLSFLLLSVVILKTNVAGLSLDISVDGPVYAQEQVYALMRIRNRKKMPAYSLNTIIPDAASATYFGVVPAAGSVEQEVRLVFRRRGLYGCPDFSVQSGFPFILFLQTVAAGASGQVLVYPRLRDVEDLIEDYEGSAELGDIAFRGRGDEVYALRQYQFGDDRKRVHWKASARQSRLLVREYAEYAAQRITLVADTFRTDYRDHIEQVISLSASLAKYFLQKGYPVRLVTPGKIIPFGSGDEHLFMILDVLALIQESEAFDHFALPDEEGFIAAVLTSVRSGMKGAVLSASMVIYADTV